VTSPPGKEERREALGYTNMSYLGKKGKAEWPPIQAMNKNGKETYMKWSLIMLVFFELRNYC